MISILDDLNPFPDLTEEELMALISHYRLLIGMLEQEYKSFGTKECLPACKKLKKKVVDLELELMELKSKKSVPPPPLEDDEQ